MADIKYYDVILRPVITEKSMGEMASKKYTFLVNPEATKSQIAEAVERIVQLYPVKLLQTSFCLFRLSKSQRQIGVKLRNARFAFVVHTDFT